MNDRLSARLAFQPAFPVNVGRSATEANDAFQGR
jgi:hypothetical protein